MTMQTLFLCINLLYGAFIGTTWHKARYINSPIKQFYSNPIRSKRVIQKQSSKPTIIYNNEFVIEVLENDLNYNKIVKACNPKNINKKIVQNIHTQSNKDTIVSFCANEDTFTFYKGKGKVLLQKMSLLSKNIVLDKNISIGCDKSLFKNKYKNSLNSDTAIIQDFEGGNVFTFIFKDNKLTQVTYKIEYME